MATWTTLPDASLEPGKPIRSIDGLALRDNPVAITEGASGAPRVQDAALNATVTTAGTNWVLARNALAPALDLGTYAIRGTLNTTVSNNTTASGSSLGLGSGTWRSMGGSTLSGQNSYFSDGFSIVDNYYTSLWLRIA